jgi:hypothetical protein
MLETYKVVIGIWLLAALQFETSGNILFREILLPWQRKIKEINFLPYDMTDRLDIQRFIMLK